MRRLALALSLAALLGTGACVSRHVAPKPVTPAAHRTVTIRARQGGAPFPFCTLRGTSLFDSAGVAVTWADDTDDSGDVHIVLHSGAWLVAGHVATTVGGGSFWVPDASRPASD